MDLMNRGVRPNQQPAPAAGGTGGMDNNSSSGKSGKFTKLKEAKWLSISWIVLLFSVTIVIAAVLASIILSDTKNEEKFVDETKMQAVFLNNGQVYFGNITELNPSYLNMVNIYYLRVNQQVQPGQQATQNDVSLVKLGCELHGPQDLMTINREQVTFWENLKDDGQVAKAVAEYVKQNPNGQNCEQQAQKQQQSSQPPKEETPKGSSTNTDSNTGGSSETNSSQPEAGTNTNSNDSPTTRNNN